MALESGDYINDLTITNPPGGDPKSQGDDHIRLLKKVLKECLNGFSGPILLTGTDVGAADAYVLTPTTAIVAYASKMLVLFSPLVTNTGACTINISGLGAKSIKTGSGSNPAAGALIAAQPLLLQYDGTNFVIIGGSSKVENSGTQTLYGDYTVSSAGSFRVPTQALATSGTYAASVDYVLNAALSGSLPAQGSFAHRSLNTDGAGAVSFGVPRSAATSIYMFKTF
jgi:hypothetical protein